MHGRYMSEHALFKDDLDLQHALSSEQALASYMRPTTIATYAAVVVQPFLAKFVPNIAQRVKNKLEMKLNLTFNDLLFWAVLLGDQALAECFWEQYHHDAAPIRMALLASRTRAPP